MPTTPLQALPYPALADPANGPAAVQNLANAVEKRTVMVYASSSDRTAKLTAPTEGMVTWLSDTNRLEVYDGTAWIALVPRAGLMLLVRGTTTQSIPNNAWTACTWATEDYDPLNTHTAAGSRFTAPISGYYSASGQVGFASNATGRRGAEFAVNGVELDASATLLIAAGAANISIPTPVRPVHLAATDYLELRAFQDSGAALNTVNAGGSESFMAVSLIQPD